MICHDFQPKLSILNIYIYILSYKVYQYIYYCITALWREWSVEKTRQVPREDEDEVDVETCTLCLLFQESLPGCHQSPESGSTTLHGPHSRLLSLSILRSSLPLGWENISLKIYNLKLSLFFLLCNLWKQYYIYFLLHCNMQSERRAKYRWRPFQ